MLFFIVVVVFLATGSFGINKSWGWSVQTSVRDWLYTSICHYCYVLSIFVPPSTVLWIRLLHSLCPNFPSYAPPWDWSSPLFVPNFPTLVPVLDWLTKKVSITDGLYRPYYTGCLTALDLLPRSLLAPSAPRRKTVSAALSPIWLSPFCCRLHL